MSLLNLHLGRGTHGDWDVMSQSREGGKTERDKHTHSNTNAHWHHICSPAALLNQLLGGHNKHNPSIHQVSLKSYSAQDILRTAPLSSTNNETCISRLPVKLRKWSVREVPRKTGVRSKQLWRMAQVLRLITRERGGIQHHQLSSASSPLRCILGGLAD